MKVFSFSPNPSHVSNGRGTNFIWSSLNLSGQRPGLKPVCVNTLKSNTSLV